MSSLSNADSESSAGGSGHNLAKQSVGVPFDSSSDSPSDSSDDSSDEEVASRNESSAKTEENVNDFNPVEDPESHTVTTFGLKEGYRHRFHDFDVVVVHGICDDLDTVWKEYPSSTTWIRDAFGDSLGDCAELYFWYDVHGSNQDCATIFDINGIEKVATCLLNDLVKTREKIRRPLKFIARDVGGLMVKMALVLARRAPSRYPGIAAETSAVILHNCPTISDSVDELEDALLRIMHLPGSRVTKGLSRKAWRLAMESYNINNDFIDINISAHARIWNLVSISQTANAKRYGTGYPLDEMQGLTTHPLEGQYKTPISHTELAHMKEKDDKSDSGDEEDEDDVKNLKEHCSAFFRDRADEDISEMELHGPQVNAVQDSISGRQVLLSLCPPIRSLTLATSISKPPIWSWLSERDAYKAWRDSAARGTRILHLQGSVSSLAFLSDEILSKLHEQFTGQDRQMSMFYFRFHRHDCRYNNALALMTSFLTQLASRSSPYAIREVARITNFIRREQALSLMDLIQLFEDMRSSNDSQKFCWVISCIEECVDSDLGKVFQAFRKSSIRHEMTFRVIVTGRENDKEKNLEGFPTIDLDSFPSSADYRAVDNDRYGGAQDALPRRSTTQIRSGLEETQKGLHDSIPLRTMVTDGLESRREDLTSGQDTLNLLRGCVNQSPADDLQVLGGPAPPSLQDMRAAALNLVRHATRPLTVRELASALAFDKIMRSRQAYEEEAFSYTVQQLTKSFQNVFAGQFVVKHNEIHLAHAVLAESASDTTSSESHRHILQLCLEYLKLPSSVSEMKQFVCELYDAELPVTPSRNSFTSYAVRYFPHHYTHSGPARPLEDVFGFFQNRVHMLSWSEAQYALANFSTRVHCGYSSMLPILTRTGLLDVVEEYLKRESGSKGNDFSKHRADWSLAIIEACRHGDIAIVRLLVNGWRPNTAEFSAAVTAAVSNGDSELIEYLLDMNSMLKGANQWSDYGQWSEDILFRVAWLGQEAAVKKLIALDVNVDPRYEAMRFEGPPLFIGIRGKHKTVIEILLAAGANTMMTGPAGVEHALVEAAKGGDSEIIDILLHHEPARTQESDTLHLPLQQACKSAAFTSMRTLLKAGANPDKAWHREDQEAGFQNPLYFCASGGYVQCVQALLQYRADVNVDVSDGTVLLQAMLNDHVDIAEMLLLHGAEPNRTSESIELPLLVAADRDNLAMVELLLEHHADVEKESETDDCPNTALAVAARWSSMEIIHCLMRHGADVNHVGKKSWSPLWGACWRKPSQLELVKELLEAGADVNAPSGHPNSLDWRPIHAAYDFPDILTTLLSAGANINQLSADSSTVLYLVSRWNHPKSVQTLLAYKDKDNKDNNIEIDRAIVDESGSEHGMTPLCIACQEGHVEIMRLLLEGGANPAHRTPTGSSPLLLCLDESDGKNIEATLRMLLEYLPREELNQRNKDGNTALHAIQAAHQVPVVRCLVNMGADMSAQNNKGFVPFQKVIEVDNLDVAAYLLSKGADIRSHSSGTGSPLRLACRASSLAMVKLLIEAGAEVNERDKQTGESILQTCIADGGNNKETLIEYLVEDGKADVNLGGGLFKCPIINNARTDYLDSDIIARLLVNNGANVNAKDHAERTVIHHSMLQSTSYLTTELLDMGADVEALDRLGRNALHYAAASGNTRLIRVIIETGNLSVDLPDSDGWTPLMWACRCRDDDNFDGVCDMLLKHGASLWSRGKGHYGEWSPLKTARYFNRIPKAHDGNVASLEPSGDQRQNEATAEVWNDEFHETRKGWDEQTPLCSGCFSDCYGIRWHCKAESECPGFYLCFVCYMHKDILHPQEGHELEEIGDIYASDPEFSDGSTQDDDASSQQSD